MMKVICWGTLLGLICPMYAMAVHSVSTVEQVPLPKLIKNLEVQVEKANPMQKARISTNLGRLYAMAYAFGDGTVPVQKYPHSTEEINFRSWLSKHGPNLESYYLPVVDAKEIVPAQRKEYLRKSIENFRSAAQIDPSDWIAKLGLAWSLIQSGQKPEAKAVLREIVKQHSHISKKIAILGEGVAQIYLNSDSQYLRVTFRDKKLVNWDLYTFALAAGARELNIRSEKGNNRKLELRAEADAYEKAPTLDNLNKILERLKASLEVGEKVEIGRSSPFPFSLEELSNYFKRLHSAHLGKKPEFDELRTALTTTDVKVCRSLIGGVYMAEGFVPLNVLCVTQVASKTKDWKTCLDFYGIPNSGDSRREIFACARRLAYMTKSSKACMDVERFFNEKKVPIMGGSTYECEQDALHRNQPPPNAENLPSLITSSEWSLEKMKIFFGRLFFSVKANDSRSLNISDVQLLHNMGPFQIDPGGADFVKKKLDAEPGLSLLMMQEFKESKKSPVRLELIDKAGKIERTWTVDYPMPPDAEDLGVPPPGFKIEDGLKKSGMAEAALYLSSLLDPIKDKAEVEELKLQIWRDIKVSDSMPKLITPLAVSLNGIEEISRLEEKKRGVRFDLLGNGMKQVWSWINGNAAWIVYRNANSHEPISGINLFGNTTFWLFWNNGFEPLCALDDNGDKRLTEQELKNLYFWKDKNSNGIQDPGELVPVEDHGVDGIDCSYQVRQDGALWNPTGIKLKDGSDLPVIDLVLENLGK